MRRKPIGAIVAWGSLAIFAVLTIMGIAGMVMGLQPQPVATARVETAAIAAEPAPPVEERLPAELSFTEAKAAEAAAAPEVQVAAAPAEVIDKGDAVIASTFEQLVKPVVVSENEVPEGAIATVQEPAAPAAEPQVADAVVKLPMRKEEGTTIVARPRAEVTRNAAAWAIESEVPDAEQQSATAMGYAAKPEDDAVHVGDSPVNVRSGPSQNNKRLFALAAGAEVNVAGKSGGWVSITDSKGRDGWVDASLLDNLKLDAVPKVKAPPVAEPEKPAVKPATAEAKPSHVRKVAGAGVTVREGPGKSHGQLFSLAGGSEVTVLDDNKGWLKITDGKGRTGWAYKDYLK
jgi:SH3-like domain-containing protein